jgi:hypothetical protein
LVRFIHEIQDHGYSFSLSVKPPTPTLDRLTDYLQVRGKERECVGGEVSPEGIHNALKGEGRYPQCLEKKVLMFLHSKKSFCLNSLILLTS